MRSRAQLMLLAALCAACGSRSYEPLSASSADTVVGRRVALVGELDGPPEYLLGTVTSVVVDRRGTIYIADRIGSTVRAYDRVGVYLGTVGAEGDGPGEFESPEDLTFDPAGRLFVRDASRLSVFTSRSESISTDSLVWSVSLGRFLPEATRGKTDGSRYFFPAYFYRNFVRERYFYLVFDSLGATGDTVQVPRFGDLALLGRANYALTSTTGRPVDGVSHAPFEAVPAWDLTVSGTLVSATGARYEIVEWGRRGDTTRVISFESKPRRVPDAWRRDSARVFQQRLDSIPVPLEQVRGMSEAAQGRRLPWVLPEVIGLEVGTGGLIWVRRWPQETHAQETVFDVLERQGHLIRTVRIPAELLSSPAPFVSPDVVAGVVKDPDSGVERVAVFAIPGS